MLRTDAPWTPPGLGWSRRAVTSTATITTADRGVIVDSTNNTFAGNLPAAATAGSGFIVGFYVSGPGTFTITGNGAETIQTTAGTATTLALTTGMGAVLQCTGTGWEAIAGAGNAANGMTLTSGRVPYATTQGRLIDSANLTFDGTNFAHGGAGTFSTGTGAILLNGTATIATGKLLVLTDLTANRMIYVGASKEIAVGTATFDGTNITVSGTIASTAQISSSKASAAANITDANSSFKLYDAGLGAGLFGMQTSGSPFAFQLQVASANMGSQFPLSLNPLGGSIRMGGDLWVNNAYVNTPQVPTGYIIIYDSGGTAYKVSCNA